MSRIGGTSFDATLLSSHRQGAHRRIHSLSDCADEPKRAIYRGECVFPPMASSSKGRDCFIPSPLRTSQGKRCGFPHGEWHIQGLRTTRKTGNTSFPLFRAAQKVKGASFPTGKGGRRIEKTSFPPLPSARKAGKTAFPRGNGIAAAFVRCGRWGMSHSLLRLKPERGGKLHSPEGKTPRLGCVRLVKETREARQRGTARYESAVLSASLLMVLQDLTGIGDTVYWPL